MKPRRLQSETSFSRTSGIAVAGMAKCTQPRGDRDVPTRRLGGSAARRLGCWLLLLQFVAQRLELLLLLLRQAVLQLHHEAELGTFDVALGAEDFVHFLEDFCLVRRHTLEE